MRDYRYMSGEDFVAGSIEMKMKWLARQLRFRDKPAEIDEWVRSMSSLINLLRKINVKETNGSEHTAERKQWMPTETNFTLSAPCKISLDQQWVASTASSRLESEGKKKTQIGINRKTG